MSRLKNNGAKPNDKFACIVSVMLKYKHILTSNWYKKGIS
ncbi:hypothetical protein HMPREF1449_00403 [Helicobacter pylori HP260AFii]|uniref:Transposase n=1 Tax=Helicobacter pylori HP260AFii TaxID=1159077 RepID=A0ABC9SA64_HELPX|nr:hypothetical protein HMPREF1449_00403 [Helicobacter pylori HP260AFii]